MKIAFTICSNNYLAQAKVLGDSIKKFSPDYNFYICLVDKYSDEINYEQEIGHKIILVEDIEIPDLKSLWRKYDIIEFNTCVKPFYFEFFMNKNTDLEYIYYFDPDTCLFDSIENIENEFFGKDVLLTPHIYTPIELDGKQPNEPIFLNYGVYNLGFLGLRNSETAKEVISWWKDRTYNLGYLNPSIGLFVDQLWFNLIPIYFENVSITKNRGINMGPWNLHERILSEINNRFFVNNVDQLILYHFSNFKYTHPDILASYYDRYNFNQREDLIDLYNGYLKSLVSVDIEKISQIPCYYMVAREIYLNELQAKVFARQLEEKKKSRTLLWWIKKVIKYSLPPIFMRLKVAAK